MPANKVILGRDQVLTLDGTPLEGVRELDIDVDTRTVDITPWNSRYASTMPICVDATLRVLIYWKEDWGRIATKMFANPPQPMTLSATNAFSVKCMAVGVKVVQPIQGVVAWEVTLRAYSYAA